MPCYHPIRAWRGTKNGVVTLHKDPGDAYQLQVPCGNCIGCRTMRAQSWALRAQLELQEHKAAVFTTLTYDDEHLPLTLSKLHVSQYIRSLRRSKADRIRFFASGEYGERTQRPHYHGIIYGLDVTEKDYIESKWTHGHVKVDQATPANIAYTAGYCSKKIGYKRISHERVDPETGEVYEWQPPFILMSRRPGIGAHAKKYLNSWRLYAVKDGHKMPVPRFFKEAYKANATPEELERLAHEIYLTHKDKPIPTRQELDAAELIATKRQQMQGEKRKL